MIQRIIGKHRKVSEKKWINTVRRRIKNNNFSIICSNCIGGIIYHRLGKQFMSPTINLWMYQYDYLKLVLNLREYMNTELEFIESEYDFPVAKLGDITLHFNHYKTEKEAKDAWDKRKKRINYDNLFLIMYDKDGLTSEDLKKLEAIKCRGKWVISNSEYSGMKYVTKIPANMDDPEKRYRLDINRWTGKRKFEEAFDYVKWLNEGN